LLKISSFSGLEAARREGMMKKIQEKTKLSPSQNCAVLHSVNFAVMKQFGKRRPPKDLCRYRIGLFINLIASLIFIGTLKSSSKERSLKHMQLGRLFKLSWVTCLLRKRKEREVTAAWLEELGTVSRTSS
jgi:hypothetical protein